MSLIELAAVSRRHTAGDEVITALDSVNLNIDSNEYVAFVGSSGSGKSTMMNILGCLDVPDSGTYLLNGRNVGGMSESELASTRNREIGFIFQNFNLLPRSTALENVMQPLVYRGIKKPDRVSRARDVLSKVGLAHRMNHLPSQLSGGQRQRVAIARALCTTPSLLIADEPTGNLDSTTSAEIMALFDDLHASGQTVVIVTHEPAVANHCSRLITLKDGHISSDRFV